MFSSVFVVQSLATEQTRSPCRWSGLPPNPFTYELASTIPQVDRIGKIYDCRILLQEPLGPLRTTEDARFKLCFLLYATWDVIREIYLDLALQTCVWRGSGSGAGILTQFSVSRAMTHLKLEFASLRNTPKIM